VTTQKILKRILSVQPAIVDPATTPTITVAAIAIDVLRAFDIAARPVSVRYDVINRAWRMWSMNHKQGGIEALMQLGGRALSVGCPASERLPDHELVFPTPWNGHLAVEVPAQRTLLDLGLRRFDRPQFDLRFSDAAGFHIPGDSWTIDTPDKGRMRIELRRQDRTFEADPAWADVAGRADYVRAVVAAVKSGRAHQVMNGTKV
jgi:hypothetical protein